MKEIKETSLDKILYTLLEYSNMFSVVIREDLGINNRIDETINRLSPFLIKKEIVNEWPGTKLLIDSATLYKFHLNRQTITILISTEPYLYNWINPNLPEDIVLYNDDKPIFISITHENFAYITKSNIVKNSIMLK